MHNDLCVTVFLLPLTLELLLLASAKMQCVAACLQSFCSSISAECVSEQDAARVLGYDRLSWDYDSGRGSFPASEDKAWLDLANTERAAAIVLGYNRRMWDELDAGPQPPVEGKTWSELSYGERTAAITLGYNQLSWDNDSGNEKMPSADEKSWDYLSEDEQYAARDLGFNRQSWDGPQPDSVYKSWSDLSSCGALKRSI